MGMTTRCTQCGQEFNPYERTQRSYQLREFNPTGVPLQQTQLNWFCSLEHVDQWIDNVLKST